MLIKYNNHLLHYDAYDSELLIGQIIIYVKYKMPQYYFYYNKDCVQLSINLYPYISITNCKTNKHFLTNSDNYSYVLKKLEPW